VASKKVKKIRRSAVASKKVKAVVPNARPYIGNSDGPSPKARAGMNEWIKQAIAHSDGALWNNGSYMIRDMKGKVGSLSVHSTGRAVDLSFRKRPQNPNANRKNALAFLKIVIENANELGVQAVLDYWPKPHGRGWNCSRQKWLKYTKPTIKGSPHGDWIHVEISPQAADSVIFVKAAFLKVFGEIPQKP
jgi:hypothetical protein